MTKEQMLSEIYEKIANKELTFGCKLKTADGKIHVTHKKLGPTFGLKTLNGDYLDDGAYEIIGHDVMIGNCDNLIEKGPNYFDDWAGILDLWIKKEEPIESQIEKCISYIHSLIK